MKRERLGYLETFGLTPLDKALREAAMSLFGKGNIPPSQFGLSSARITKPWISIPLWLGITGNGRKVPLYNFFNREIAPRGEPYSIRVTFARDFMGGQWTYDGHIGTDFAIPVGTRIVTAAPGVVIRVARHFDHGGLKIYIDHGAGLVTMYEHLARTHVVEGDTVSRGQTIAISGASGIDMFAFSPWVAPHLHFNVVLNGIPVDPFAIGGETSLWLSHNDPLPHTGATDTSFTPTDWDEQLISAAISECSDPRQKARLQSIAATPQRAAELIGDRISYKTLFPQLPPIYQPEFPRKPLLDLPLCAEDYDGVKLPTR